MSQKEKPTSSRPSDSAIHEPDSLSSTSEPTSDSGTYDYAYIGHASVKAPKNVFQSAQSNDELVVTPDPSPSIPQNQGVEEAQSVIGDDDSLVSQAFALAPVHQNEVVEPQPLIDVDDSQEIHSPPSSHAPEALHSQVTSSASSQASTPGSENHVASPLPISSPNSNEIQGTSVVAPNLSRSDSSPDSTRHPPVLESTPGSIELNTLKSENEDLQKKLLELYAKFEVIFDLQKEIGHKNEEIGQKNEEIQRLSKRVNELELHKANTEKSAQERETNIIESKDTEISKLKSTVESMRSDILRLKIELKGTTDAIAIRTEQSNLSGDHIVTLKRIIDGLESKITEKEREKNDLQKELTSVCSKQAERRERQKKELTDTKDKLEERDDELKMIKSLLKEKESEIISLKEEKKKHTKELKSSRKDQELFQRYLKLFD